MIKKSLREGGPGRGPERYRFARYAVLGSLALASAGLTLLILDDAKTKAQTLDPTVWKAGDPAAAVETLLRTPGFSSILGAHIPGALADGDEGKKGIRGAAFNSYLQLSEIREGRKTPLFQVQLDPDGIKPKEVQHAVPKLNMIAVMTEGKAPKLGFLPGSNAILVTPDGKETRNPILTDAPKAQGPVKMDPSIFMFDIVNEKLVAEKKTTTARLRGFVADIKAAMEEGAEADLTKVKLGSKGRDTDNGVFKLRVVLDPVGSPTIYAVEEALLGADR